jgi:hypothetical protein
MEIKRVLIEERWMLLEAGSNPDIMLKLGREFTTFLHRNALAWYGR